MLMMAWPSIIIATVTLFALTSSCSAFVPRTTNHRVLPSLSSIGTRNRQRQRSSTTLAFSGNSVSTANVNGTSVYSPMNGTAAKDFIPEVEEELAFGILENSMKDVEIIPDFCPKYKGPINGNGMDTEDPFDFVSMLRGSANYIATHRKNTIVLHIPATLFDIHHSRAAKDDDERSKWARQSKKLLDDIALLWLLGIKIVIVIGVRGLVEERLKKEFGDDTSYDDDVVIHKGIRVTDESRLRAIEEAAGYARFEIECQLGRALKGKDHLRSHSLGANVVSGNYYSAKPIGVRDGIDYKYTGLLRRVEVEKINQAHNNDDVVIMTSLGVSPSGELFCVNSECLAAGVASKLNADKIIYMLEEPAHIRETSTKNEVMIIRLSEAKRLLQNFNVHVDDVGGERVVADPYNPFFNHPETSAVKEFLEKVGFSANALTNGVKRAHLVCPSDGSLLEELFTRDDGTGTMISRDLYDGIRQAKVKDVDGILELIQPLIDAGTLVARPQTVLEKEIDTFYVYTRDGLVVACGQLKVFENGYAEIGCLAVKSDYRKSGKGDAMLSKLFIFASGTICMVHLRFKAY